MGNKWPGIQDQIDASKKHVSVLPVDSERRSALRADGSIGWNTVLGTVLNHCGGIVVEGWIRIYGAGALDFASRNAAWGLDKTVVAEDVIGGLYAGMADGTVGYFAPATLVWEPLHLSYPQFIDWCLRGDTKMFYELQRWRGWEHEVLNLGTDEGYAISPELWRLGSSVDDRLRTVVPIFDLVRNLLDTSEERRKKFEKERQNSDPGRSEPAG